MYVLKQIKKKIIWSLFERFIRNEFIYWLTNVLYMLFAWYYVAIFVSVVSIVMTFMCKVQSGVERLSGKEKNNTHIHSGRAHRCRLLARRHGWTSLKKKSENKVWVHCIVTCSISVGKRTGLKKGHATCTHVTCVCLLSSITADKVLGRSCAIFFFLLYFSHRSWFLFFIFPLFSVNQKGRQ